ncbi:MAG: aminoacetone oxidase family FAD-binding enzyme [Methanobacteriaceae archaeon]|nr:aminoacetone oxidase family FAD-binding enzyme [Methanobacteriaceae archaeon]
MKEYNTIIIGGGPAGIIANILLKNENTILLEQNDTLGKKLLLTGNQRCNLTNHSNLKTFIKSFRKAGNYYRPAFNNFFIEDLMNLIEDNGCPLKIEENNRVFPKSDDAKSVLDALYKSLDKTHKKYKYNAKVTNITKKEEKYLVEINNSEELLTRNILIATGGTAYPHTGSTGDGYKFAEKLGHSITNKTYGLAPLYIEEDWITQLQATVLENKKIQVKTPEKRIINTEGTILFTHFGLSGPTILNISSQITKALETCDKVTIEIELVKTGYDQLDKQLQKDFEEKPLIGLKKYLHKYLPPSMIECFCYDILKIEDYKILNQITKKERLLIRDTLKRLTVTTKKVAINTSMVSCGGISRKEINPNTLESNISPNIYFAGEIIEGCGLSGGFNLQQAFSTGALVAKTINEKP